MKGYKWINQSPRWHLRADRAVWRVRLHPQQNELKRRDRLGRDDCFLFSLWGRLAINHSELDKDRNYLECGQLAGPLSAITSQFRSLSAIHSKCQFWPQSRSNDLNSSIKRTGLTATQGFHINIHLVNKGMDSSAWRVENWNAEYPHTCTIIRILKGRSV